MHIVTHPTLTPACIATMSAHELAFFTDAPVAHEVAYRDFQRDLIIEARNAEVARLIARRDRAARAQRLAAIAWGA